MTSFCSNVMKWSARSLPSRPGGFKSYRLNFLNSSAWQKASAEPGPIETRRTFSETGSALKQQQQSLEKSNPAPKPRISAGKASLRGVAAEAQWSRSGFIRGKGRRQFVDPEVETKEVRAYCAAEQYNILTVARLIKADGHELDPYQTGLYPQVVHFRTAYRITEGPDGAETERTDAGDIFVFPSGTVVAWNVPEKHVMRFVTKVLPEAAGNSHLDLIETENLIYVEDPSTESSRIVGDTIILGTNIEKQVQEAQQQDRTDLVHPEADTVLAKIAFSSGLARSTKLAVMESLFDDYFESTRAIPMVLSQWRGPKTSLGLKSKFPYDRPFILRKTGELLNIRAQLNLYSELTDSLPDLFWDSRHELGLEDYYDQVGRVLDVGVRIKVLNEKMNYAQEIATVLRERLSEEHGLKLEWYIIWLIAIEVLFEFSRHGMEWYHSRDPQNTEALLRRYLLEVLEGQNVEKEK